MARLRLMVLLSKKDPVHKVWLASRLFLTGELDVKKFKKIERAYYIKKYKGIVLAPTMFDLLSDLLGRTLFSSQFTI